MTFDACLMAYGLIAAWAAPRLLTMQTARGLAPRLGVAAWLAAATSVLGSWLGAGVALLEHPGIVTRSVGMALLVGLVTRIAWAGARTCWTNRVRRNRHSEAAMLLGHRDAELAAVVLDSPEPAVYCLPGAGGLVVVTTGARAALSVPQLQAVLAHERAHLAGRHHLLLAMGQIMGHALPRLRLFGQLGTHIGGLLEMRADDAAARVHGARTVAAAIAAMGSRTNPSGALGAGGATALVRAARLCRADQAGPSWGARLALVATGSFLAVGPYLATLPPCPHPW